MTSPPRADGRRVLAAVFVVAALLAGGVVAQAVLSDRTGILRRGDPVRQAPPAPRGLPAGP